MLCNNDIKIPFYCQEEIKLYRLPFVEQEKPTSPASKKPKRRFTREEQYEHGPERKKSFNRRWKSSKKERDELEATYPGRNSFTYKHNLFVTPSNILPLHSKKYIISARTYVEKSSDNYDIKQEEFDGSLLAFANRNASMFNDMTTLEFQATQFNPWYDSSDRRLETTLTTIHKAKKRTSMIAIPDYLSKIRSFKPTLAGQVELSLYDPKAIDIADSKLMGISGLRDPFRYFLKVVEEATKKNRLPLNFDQRNKLRMQYPVDANEPRFDASYVAPKSSKAATAAKATSSSRGKDLLNATHLYAVRLFEQDVPTYKRSQFYVMRQLENRAQDFPQSQASWNAWYSSPEADAFKAWLQDYPMDYVADWDPFTFDYDAYRLAKITMEKAGGKSFDVPFVAAPEQNIVPYNKRTEVREFTPVLEEFYQPVDESIWQEM